MDYKTRIKFDNKEWLVINNIQYKDKKYYYIVEDIEDFENYKGNIQAEFIYESEKNIFKNVTDEKLIDRLMAFCGIDILKNF